MIGAASAADSLELAPIAATLPAIDARVASERVTVELAAASFATRFSKRRDLEAPHLLTAPDLPDLLPEIV